MSCERALACGKSLARHSDHSATSSRRDRNRLECRSLAGTRLAQAPRSASLTADRAAPGASRPANHREFSTTSALRLARPDGRLEERGERPTNSGLRGDRFEDRRAPCLDCGCSACRLPLHPRRSPQSPRGSRRSLGHALPSSYRLPPIVAPSASIATGSAPIVARTAPIAPARASIATPSASNGGSVRRDPRLLRRNRHALRRDRHTDRVDRLKLRGKTRELWVARLSKRGSRHSGRVARRNGGRDRIDLCRDHFGVRQLEHDFTRRARPGCRSRGSR